MDHTYLSRPGRKRRRGRGRLFFSLILVVLCIGAAAVLWLDRAYGPVDTRITPDYGTDKPIFYQGIALEGGAIGSGESLKLPLQIIQSVIDPDIHYEESSSSIIITTEHQVLRMVTDQLTAWVNDQPFELRFPAEQTDGAVYVPAAPLAELYGVEVREHPGKGYVTLLKTGDVLARVAAPAATGDDEPRPVLLRSAPTVRAPIVGELPAGEAADVWGEEEGWYSLQLVDGTVGFADKHSVVWSGTETFRPEAAEQKSPYIPKREWGRHIVLTWEQVYSRNPDTSKLGPMPGLNVVSPTWFHVLDQEGALENRADHAYVQWAHQRGYQVWALFSNSFDPELTSEVLSTFDRRMNMARQLIAWAELYDLDGINVDFENVNIADGPKLTQFMRELTPLLHEAGLTVSMDVTFAGGSSNWSLFYERKELAEIIDYMMVMAYDEHWAASPVAGSVASLPWVEKGVRQLIEEEGVTAQKLVLGVPFYTRIWTESTVDGKKKVSSKAVGMDTVAALLNEKGLQPKLDEATGQHYVEYKEEGAVKKIWIEDETSMNARMALVRELGLAGVASWSRNFASETIWQAMDEALH